MINFHRIRWKNTLSTGQNFIEIDLNQHSTTLMVGENGSGKSTILDALTFSLFGKAFRNINKSQIVNSINDRNCLIETEFSISKKNYIVRRGIKPNIFEIEVDGKMINQDSKTRDYQEHLEKNILKLNYKSFTQIVVLGSTSFIPFMQLKASDRRVIIEDLLGIQIFSTMNLLLKGKISNLKNEQYQNELMFSKTENALELQEDYISKMKKSNKQLIASNQKNIKESNNQIKQYNSQIAVCDKDISVLQKLICNFDKIHVKHQKLEKYQYNIEKNLKQLEKEINFYNENSDCPTCNQTIDDEHRTCEIHLKEDKKTKLNEAISKIGKEITSSFNSISEMQLTQKNITEIQSTVTKYNASIFAINQYIEKINEEINQLNEKGADVSDALIQLKELKLDHKKFLSLKEQYSNLHSVYDTASVLLKDNGIKTLIIKKYLPIMNNLINKYLTLMEFYISFNLDENFGETIKSRFRDIFTYASFSEGEKMRIDLALLFTWRTIAKLKNSMSTNLLILDEVFDSSLDEDGTSDFLKIIHSLGGESNVFVISHKGEILYDKFKHVIKFEKFKNFSRIVQ
ncbi:MAG: AAA family ATPase [Cryomorphaceae bacterium]|jgi:DNA repair exonuclease SbcCD ATPase subunit|nr:AAA family ATPase [Cryomorphaceae bacterium]